MMDRPVRDDGSGQRWFFFFNFYFILVGLVSDFEAMELKCLRSLFVEAGIYM